MYSDVKGQSEWLLNLVNGLQRALARECPSPHGTATRCRGIYASHRQSFDYRVLGEKTLTSKCTPLKNRFILVEGPLVAVWREVRSKDDSPKPRRWTLGEKNKVGSWTLTWNLMLLECIPPTQRKNLGKRRGWWGSLYGRQVREDPERRTQYIKNLGIVIFPWNCW